ncbi:TrkH family potassium uptake protein [Lentibacter sp. XHP0401]|uniref:TrkH family potassium uptake protein n=1 Tax=Lentibacter sp. XHP0401 TaxID=2984334 RepID=UPI0021E79798|nr:TrkH family potassium uptake protein [Lentibacter sp. XHP0401]MCV2894607.1 TrkH family potassium uptake protein [Lentibacter sp. XHP0401]
MFDLRPVGYVIGLLVTALGLTMLAPMTIDLIDGRGHWTAFAESAVITALIGGLVALACQNGVKEGLNIQQTFLLTTSVWVALPIFGALPLIIGASELSTIDAVFEAMSGLTTTGATVMTGLDDLPRGILLWRSILQWLGGIGIIVVAMVFLPELRVGGMQIFRAEAFDTFGKILPRATQIASQISAVYVSVTVACVVTYVVLGMSIFDAITHAFTTVSTGGMANYDASFSVFSGPLEYAASVFMLLSALPFVRYVQMLNGHFNAPLLDVQVRGFLYTVATLVIVTSVLLTQIFPHHWEQAFREALFNITSIISGTGYSSVDYMSWGSFLITVFFFVGLIGGCAGSTACSIKIFRYQILFASIASQIKKIRSPHGVFTPKYSGRPIGEDVLNSVMSFFVFFVLTLGLIAVALSFTGLDFVTSISGAAATVANIGPGLGDIIGPAGNYATLNDAAKVILTFSMLIGRLELLVVYALVIPAFWRG